MCLDLKSNPMNQNQEDIDNKQFNVFLQTPFMHLSGNHISCKVPVLIDTGSQKSYILKSTVMVGNWEVWE